MTIGHVTKLSALPPAELKEKARRLADAGVPVLPARHGPLSNGPKPRAFGHAGRCSGSQTAAGGVDCSLFTSNVLNPFMPYGDCSLVRMANLYANICQVGDRGGLEECFEMATSRSARLMRLTDYGIEVGRRRTWWFWIVTNGRRRWQKWCLRSWASRPVAVPSTARPPRWRDPANRGVRGESAWAL